MQSRAFVVMPFSTRKPVGFDGQEIEPHREINFDHVYDHLFVPALKQAGYEAFRADSEVGAGDIRTDMFFELVTADLVVADISILNANVFYELGIRHGVCPRGVLIVKNNLVPSRPFDIAPDRSFTYDASLFIECGTSGLNGLQNDLLRSEQDRLASAFKNAVAVESETIGSPVYSHLPGLKPVDW